MTAKLSLLAIAALSVPATVAHLAEVEYDTDELSNFLAAEEARDDTRKGCVEAFTAALTEAEAPAEAAPTTAKVADGKSLTTLAGIKTAGAEITPDMLSGGEKTLAYLIKQGFLK